MHQFTEFPNDKIVALTIDGHVSRQDFQDMQKKFEHKIDEWGELKLLEVVKSFSGMEPTALWDDIKFSLKHYKDFSKAALVTDKKWIEIVTKTVTPFVPMPLKVFEMDEIEEAKEWLRQ